MAQFWSIQSSEELSSVKIDEDGDIVISQRGFDGETVSVFFGKEDFEAMIAACQSRDKEAEPEPTPKQESYQDISSSSIENIEVQIYSWVENLTPGDEVFVMYSPVHWQVSEHSYKSKVTKVTNKRVTLENGTTYHRASGLAVNGVDSVGDYRLIPPWLSPKDLESAWMTMQIIARWGRLKRVPITKLMAALALLESEE